MAATEVGKCECPLCRAADAVVKIGEKKKHQINCDECGSLIRTMTRKGDAAIVALMTPAVTELPPVPVDPSPKPTPKKKRSLLDEMLGTGADK